MALIDLIYKRDELPIDSFLIDDEITPEIFWAP